MSGEKIMEIDAEELSRIRRMKRIRRARQKRRVQGCLLAVVLMAALAAYAGSRAAHHAEAGDLRAQASQLFQGPAATYTVLPPAIAGQGGGSMDPEADRPFTGEEFDGLVSAVLDGVIRDGMTKLEQARAVFDYVHDHISYTGHSDKSDWMTGAYTGLTTGKGDCFTYYAVSRALLTALEIDNLPVERVGGETRHYWNLVDCGDGWYHFDACPRSSRLPPFVSFMFTDRQAADFTAEAGRSYYDFDGSLLPERAAEIIAED